MIHRYIPIYAAALFMVLAVTVAVSAPAPEDDGVWFSVFERWHGNMAIVLGDRIINMTTHERFETAEDCNVFIQSPVVVGSVDLLLADAKAEDVTATVVLSCMQGEPI